MKSKSILYTSIIVLVVVLLGVGINYAIKRTSAPLGPALNLPTPSDTPVEAGAEAGATAVGAAAPLSGAGTGTPATESPAGVKAPLASPKEPVCGGPESMLILGIGADSSAYQYGLADVIRIARLDFVNERIVMISLPRDLWVEIPEIEAVYGENAHGKLNQAYLFGGPGMGYYKNEDGTPGAAGGPGLLALTLQHNFGLRVDHYAAANFEVFERIVDALGGVDVDLPYDVDDTGVDGTGLYFTAGKHHFNGETALAFARIRRKYSDFQRQDNQSLVIAALRERVLSPEVLPRLPQLVDAFRDEVLTDLSLEQIAQSACLLGRVGTDEIVMTQLPAELYTVGWEYSASMKDNVSIVRADPAAVAEYLRRFAEGEWPE